MAYPERGHTLQHLVDGQPFATIERVLRIAVLATQRTTREANEHGRPPDRIRFSLNGKENLSDLDARRRHDCRMKLRATVMNVRRPQACYGPARRTASLRRRCRLTAPRFPSSSSAGPPASPLWYPRNEKRPG